MTDINQLNSSFFHLFAALVYADCNIERRLKKNIDTGQKRQGFTLHPPYGDYQEYKDKYIFNACSSLTDFEKELHTRKKVFFENLLSYSNNQKNIDHLVYYLNKLWALKTHFYPTIPGGQLLHWNLSKNIFGDPPELNQKEENNKPVNIADVERYIEENFTVEIFYPFVQIQFNYLTLLINELGNRYISSSDQGPKKIRKMAITSSYKLKTKRSQIRELKNLWEALYPKYIVCKLPAFIDIFDETVNPKPRIRWLGTQSELGFLITTINSKCIEIEKPKDFWQNLCSIFIIPGKSSLDPRKIKHTIEIASGTFENNVLSAFS